VTFLKEHIENAAIIPADTEVPRGGRFPALAAAIGFVFTFCAFYPGVLSSDSLDQFQQALNFHFSDWHPPAMAILWSLLTRIWSGPQLMLLMQEALFWGGVYFLLSALDIRAIWSRIIVVLLLFSPVLLNFSGVIWKDVQLAAAWIFVLASVFATRQRGIPLSGAHKAGLLILILYGALVRINAGIVAGPLVLYALTGRARLDSLWRSVAVYAGLALTCFFLGQGIIRALPVDRSAVVDSLQTFDLAALSTEKNENLFPFPLSDAELRSVKTCYGDASTQDPFIWGDCKFVWKKVSATREQNRRALMRAWRSAILHAPGLYLAARFRHFGAFLALTRPPGNYVWVSGFAPNSFGFPTTMEGVYRPLGAYVEAFRGSILFRPALWLGLALFAMAAPRWSVAPESAAARMTFTAGLVSVGYLMTFLPFGVASDFRYAYLPIAMITFAICAMVAGVASRLRRGEASGHSLREIFRWEA
jgi:hypothetical protein